MNATNLQTLAVLNMALSFLLPLVQQAVTNISAPPPVKVAITALMAAIVGFVTPFISGLQSWSNFEWKVAVLSIGSVFLTSVLSHYGLWKPVGVTGAEGSIANKLPGGVGAPAGPDVSSVGYETDPPVGTVEDHSDLPVTDPVTSDPAPVDPTDPAQPVDAPVDPSVGADVVLPGAGE
jgi:hypothetical protein